MDKYISFLLLFINVGCIVTAVPIPEEYYWREFEGIIPADALKAGFDEYGSPLYIGQALVGNKLIPGKIYENDDNVYYEWKEQAWSTNQNVKILCTETPENFEWLSTTSREVAKIKSKSLVRGGYQPDFLTYVGRVHRGGKANIGKVICRETNCLAMYATENGHGVEYHNFEILSYNPIIVIELELYYINDTDSNDIKDEQYLVYQI